jgi:hypothetical protein
MAKPYRRQTRVIKRAGISGGTPGGAFSRPVLDGGEDAPLSPRGRFMYHWIIGGIVVVGVGLLLLFR